MSDEPTQEQTPDRPPEAVHATVDDLTDTAPGRMTTGSVVSYALGDVANNLTFLMTSMFLMVYMTDIAGVPAAVAGTIYGVTKIWAGITDLVSGNTVDKANTRWGRLRPWLLWISSPLAIIFVLLFSTPAGLSPAAAVAWILLLDAGYQLAYSFINIPYGSLSAAMTQDSVDRSRLSGARSIASSVTGVLLAAIIAPQFQNTAADNIRMQFTLTTLVLAAIAVALYLTCFMRTREVVPRSPGKVKLSNTMMMLRQNRPLITLCLGALFLLASIFTMNAVGMYYARYVLGNAGWFMFLMLAQTVGTVAVASLVPMITVRLGKRKGYVLAAVVIIVAYAIIFIVPGGNLPIALVAWLLFGIGSGGTNALMFSMQADTVDYGEWKTGIRSEGGSYSILSFIRKCGQGVGGWLGAVVIGMFGYVAKAPAQSEQALQGIRIATGVVPGIFAVLAAVVMLRYPLTERQHRELVGELSERRMREAVKAAHGLEDADVAVEPMGDGRTTLVTPGATRPRPIVTFFERDGSGMIEIAPMVAERLGVAYVGQRFTSDEIAGMDRAVLLTEGAFDRWLRRISFGGTPDADLSRAVDLSDNHAIAVENTAEVLTAVEDGAVITGRNATLILGRAAGALHVRLTAPLELRVARVAAETGLEPDAAADRIVHEEAIRSEMSRRLYQWDPNVDEYYDLVINTGSVTYDEVAELIVGMYRRKYPDLTGD